jgi:hypothetical protein
VSIDCQHTSPVISVANAQEEQQKKNKWAMEERVASFVGA